MRAKYLSSPHAANFCFCSIGVIAAQIVKEETVARAGCSGEAKALKLSLVAAIQMCYVLAAQEGSEAQVIQTNMAMALKTNVSLPAVASVINQDTGRTSVRE